MGKDTIISIDLHGCIADDVFDLLDQFIRKYKKQRRLMVIVGKGRGIVRKKVIEYLKMAHYSWNYEKIKGQVNEGALVVELY